MTCFWTGILSSLTIDDFRFIDIDAKPAIKDFIHILKTKNTKSNDVYWNNSKLSEKEYIENIEHVKDYKIDTIHNGYLCSTCDPFLLLISQIFCLEIIHNYNGHIIKYRNIVSNRKPLHFRSNMGHFWKE